MDPSNTNIPYNRYENGTRFNFGNNRPNNFNPQSHPQGVLARHHFPVTSLANTYIPIQYRAPTQSIQDQPRPFFSRRDPNQPDPRPQYPLNRLYSRQEEFIAAYEHARRCDRQFCSPHCLKMKSFFNHVYNCSGCDATLCFAIKEIMALSGHVNKSGPPIARPRPRSVNPQQSIPEASYISTNEREYRKNQLFESVRRHIISPEQLKKALTYVNMQEQGIYNQSTSVDEYIKQFSEFSEALERKFITPPARTPSLDIKPSVKKEVTPERPSMPTLQVPKEEAHTPAAKTPQKPVFVTKKIAPQDIKEAFVPLIDKIKAMTESRLFQLPVDPIRDGAPNYFEIVKNPMDLSVMFNKLQDLEYNCPWDLIDDFHTMVDNSKLYNGVKNHITRNAFKLLSAFNNEAESIMKERLRYCCKNKYVFNLHMLYCCSPLGCQIGADGDYYSCEKKGEDVYIMCEKCFNSTPGQFITQPGASSNESIQLPKADFVKSKNNVIVHEKFVKCIYCDRRNHEICVLYNEMLYNEGYVCKECISDGAPPTELKNTLTAKNLRTTNLSDFMEEKVNRFIRKESGCIPSGHVYVRVLSSIDRVCEVKPNMTKRYVEKGEMPASFSYKAKSIYFFQVNGDKECVFFSMHTQEYGSECPEPNNRRVYIAYLDSVHYFDVPFLRSGVYHQGIISYLEYKRNMGFMTAHIWACPPSERDDYIFHSHPPEQKMPTAKRLSDWYKIMLNTALQEKVIRSYQDMSAYMIDNGITSLNQIPYMEGDFWPCQFEEIIKAVDEEEQRIKDGSQLMSNSSESVKRPNSKTEAKKSKKTKSKIRRKTPNIAPNGLKEKFLNTLEKHKNIFFVIELHPPGAGSQMSRIVDPDPSIHCDLTDTRDSFLTFCRDRNYEFSSKRRALHSTLSILIELHSSSSNAYHCNSCKKTISGVRFHCNICKDFDLCQECSTSVDHCHKLNKTIDILPSNKSPAQIANSDPSRSQSRTMEDNIAEINHIVNCLDANCAKDVCKQYRRVLLPHYGACKNRRNCRTCEQITRLYTMHSRQCKNDNCNAKYCREFKNHFVNVDKQRRIRNQGLQNRRIRAMNVDTVDNTQLPSNIGTNLVPRQQQRLPSQIRQYRPRQDNNGGRGIPPYRVPSNVGVPRNGYLNYPPSHNVDIEHYKRRCPGTPYPTNQDEYHRYRMEFDQSELRRQSMGRPQINQHHISYMNQRPQTVYNHAGMTNYNHGQYGYPDRQNMPKIRPVMHPTMYDNRNPSQEQYQMPYHVERGQNAPIYRQQGNSGGRGVPNVNNFNFLRSPHPNLNFIGDTSNFQMSNSQNVIRPANPGQYEQSPRVDSE